MSPDKYIFSHKSFDQKRKINIINIYTMNNNQELEFMSLTLTSSHIFLQSGYRSTLYWTT